MAEPKVYNFDGFVVEVTHKTISASKNSPANAVQSGDDSMTHRELPANGYSTCSICFNVVQAGDKIVLNCCRENCCRACFINSLLGNKASVIKCPSKLGKCDQVIAGEDIKLLIGAQGYDNFIKSQSAVSSSLLFPKDSTKVLIPEVAQPGCNNILSPRVLKDIPTDFFTSSEQGPAPTNAPSMFSSSDFKNANMTDTRRTKMPKTQPEVRENVQVPRLTSPERTQGAAGLWGRRIHPSFQGQGSPDVKFTHQPFVAQGLLERPSACFQEVTNVPLGENEIRTVQNQGSPHIPPLTAEEQMRLRTLRLRERRSTNPQDEYTNEVLKVTDQSEEIQEPPINSVKKKQSEPKSHLIASSQESSLQSDPQIQPSTLSYMNTPSPRLGQRISSSQVWPLYTATPLMSSQSSSRFSSKLITNASSVLQSNSIQPPRSTPIQATRTSALDTNAEDFVCSICFTFVIKKEGLALKNCRHNFCRNCLLSVVKSSHRLPVMCPMKYEKCESEITLREIEDLLGREDYSEFIVRTSEEEVRRNNTLLALLELEDSEYVENRDVFHCQICMTDIEPGSGLVLKNCLHEFCKRCLGRIIEFSDDVDVLCPFVADDGSQCKKDIQDREMRSLVSPDVMEKRLAKSLSHAEAVIKNAFHCKTPNCPGWAEVEDARTFYCPLCSKANCIKCKAIHEGKSCEEYFYEINADARKARDDILTEDQVKTLIATQQAMLCPGCQSVIQKSEGCNHMTCSRCKKEFQWLGRQ